MMTLLALLLRLARPTRGAHTTPFGYLYELGFEARRRRSRRVRRYVETLAPLNTRATEPPPEPASPTPPTPAPRLPLEDHHRIELVRGPYRAWKTRQALLAGVAG